jgi:hypothetical protein
MQHSASPLAYGRLTYPAVNTAPFKDSVVSVLDKGGAKKCHNNIVGYGFAFGQIDRHHVAKINGVGKQQNFKII